MAFKVTKETHLKMCQWEGFGKGLTGQRLSFMWAAAAHGMEAQTKENGGASCVPASFPLCFWTAFISSHHNVATTTFHFDGLHLQMVSWNKPSPALPLLVILSQQQENWLLKPPKKEPWSKTSAGQMLFLLNFPSGATSVILRETASLLLMES